MKKSKIAITLGIICMFLTIGICIQIKTVKYMTKEVGSSVNDNSNLKAELFQLKNKYNSSMYEIELLENELEIIRTEAIKDNKEESGMEQEIKKDKELLGMTEVKGRGIIIKLDDNRSVSSNEVLNISDYLVHNGDLIQIVNELFNAGADAISINGQRIVSTTSIICDGNILRINDNIIGVPIEIKAIGYPERLYYALERPGGYLEYMKNDGVIVSVTKEEEITIPKYEGIYSYKYILRGDK